MKRVVITGATGFVGANLARRLLDDGHELHLLVRPGYKPWRIAEIHHDVRLHELHLHDTETTLAIIGKIRPEWIFHLAVHGAYSWEKDWEQMIRTNVQGTMSLLSACLQTGFETFVNTGSSSEYGFKNHAPTETEALDPNSHYAITKAAGTMFCRQTAQAHQVHVPTLRLYSAYGPFEEPGRLMPTLILNCLKGGLPSLADPNIARDFVYVDDVVDAYLAAARKRNSDLGAIYNVGTGIQTTLRELVETARKTFGITAEPVWNTMPNRNWDANVWVSDNRKIRSELGWTPRHSLSAGLHLMRDWFGRGIPSPYEMTG
jgi:dolichol-phosphate mannosyltransferase